MEPIPATRAPRKRDAALWPLLAAIAGIAAALALGNWQLGRAAEKREARARLEAAAAQPPISVSSAPLAAADVESRRVEARGVFDPRHTVYIDNRIHRGVPGYHVVTPLRLPGGDRHVLVNRGWVAQTANRAELPQVPTPHGTVTVTGIAAVPGKRTLELADTVIEGRVWQNLTIERYATARPIAIQPFVIRQDSPADDGLVREWPAPDLGIDKHYGYAFQWYALAATILGFYGYTRYRRRKTAA
jgi:surfeit locus 1 family protein